jgi:hypothetical protein
MDQQLEQGPETVPFATGQQRLEDLPLAVGEIFARSDG